MEPSSSEAAPLTVTGLSLVIGSTFGGSTIVITGTGFRSGARVTFGGVSASYSTLQTAFLYEGSLYVSAPPHEAGLVTVVVTNPGGQSVALPNGYTYASAGFFEIDGDWEGGTGLDWQTPLAFTIRNGVVVNASCGKVPVLTESSTAEVRDGEFTIWNGDAVVMTGHLVSDGRARGTVNSVACGRDQWLADKKVP